MTAGWRHIISGRSLMLTPRKYGIPLAHVLFYFGTALYAPRHAAHTVPPRSFQLRRCYRTTGIGWLGDDIIAWRDFASTPRFIRFPTTCWHSIFCIDAEMIINIFKRDNLTVEHRCALFSAPPPPYPRQKAASIFSLTWPAFHRDYWHIPQPARQLLLPVTLCFWCFLSWWYTYGYDIGQVLMIILFIMPPQPHRLDDKRHISLQMPFHTASMPIRMRKSWISREYFLLQHTATLSQWANFCPLRVNMFLPDWVMTFTQRAADRCLWDMGIFE